MGLFSSKPKTDIKPRLTCNVNDVGSYKCILLASYRKLPIDIVWDDSSVHEDKMSASLQMSNLDRFPSVDDGEFTIIGPNAVLTYLNIKGGAPSVQPHKARVLAMQQYWIEVLKTKVEPLINNISEHGKKLEKVFAVFDKNLEGKQHIVGEFSLADIHWGAVISMLEKDHRSLLSKYKNINQWIAAIKEEIPGFSSSLKEVAA